MKLRIAEQPQLEGKAFDPYSNLNLANIALTVEFNNMAAEIHQLMPAELYPLAEELNSAAETEDVPGVDAATMKSLKLLMKQAFDKDSSGFEQGVRRHLDGAPDEFKQKVLGVLALGVYDSPDGQTAAE